MGILLKKNRSGFSGQNRLISNHMGYMVRKTWGKELSLIIDTIPNPIIEINKDKKIIAANRSAIEKWHEIKEGESNCLDILFGNCPDKENNLIDRCIKTRQPLTEVIRNERGEFLSIKTNFISNPDNVRIVLHITDITEKIKKDIELKRSEVIYKNLIENSPGPIMVHINLKIVLVNKSCVDLLEAESDKELLGKNALDFVVEEDKKIIRERIKETIVSDIRLAPVEIRLIGLKGKLINVETIGEPIIYSNKKAIQVIIFDLTERKLIEENLRISEEKYRTLALNIPLGVFRTTPSGKILSANPAISEIFGFESPKEFIAADVKKLYSNPNDRTVLIQKLKKEGEIKDYEVLFKKKNGEKFWGSVNETAIMDESGRINFVDGIMVDVTEKKMIEKEVLKKEKLDSLGLLAGGIAHDFNNILTAVIGNIGLVKIDKGTNKKMREKLERAENSVLRAKKLTHQLLTFSKGGEPVKKIFNLTDIIKNTIGFSVSGLKVKIVYNIDEDLWNVKVDEGQISQVIQNLVINAAQSMPEGGEIEIFAKNCKISDSLSIERSGDFVKISVADCGSGIPKDIIDKIFDPFFTTKQKGSGLGLSTAYSIINNHEGYIKVDSKPGIGSEFSIFIPAILDKKEDTGDYSIKDRDLKRKKILFMDDEDMITESMEELLKSRGYIVECCSNGKEAIKKYKRAMNEKKPFGVVILDLIIPGGMGGKDTLLKLKKIDPKVMAIASSGYSTDKIMSDFISFGFKHAIAKPYRIDDLVKLIKKCFKKSNSVYLKKKVKIQ